jgi:hypothetical protein
VEPAPPQPSAARLSPGWPCSLRMWLVEALREAPSSTIVRIFARAVREPPLHHARRGSRGPLWQHPYNAHGLYLPAGRRKPGEQAGGRVRCARNRRLAQSEALRFSNVRGVAGAILTPIMAASRRHFHSGQLQLITYSSHMSMDQFP